MKYIDQWSLMSNWNWRSKKIVKKFTEYEFRDLCYNVDCDIILYSLTNNTRAHLIIYKYNNYAYDRANFDVHKKFNIPLPIHRLSI